MDRKTNPSAKLKTLPEKAQERLWAMLTESGADGEKPLSYREAVPQIKKLFGVVSSAAALSEWFSWYGLRLRMRRAETLAEQAKMEWVEKHPDASPDDLVRLGQMVFTSSALESGDAKTFLALAQFGERMKAGDRDSRRVALLEERSAEAKARLEMIAARERKGGGISEETLAELEEAARLL